MIKWVKSLISDLERKCRGVGSEMKIQVWFFWRGFNGRARLFDHDFFIMTFSSCWLLRLKLFIFERSRYFFVILVRLFIVGAFWGLQRHFWFRCYFLWLRSRCCFLGCFLMISTQTFDHAFFEVLLLIIKTKIYFYYYDKLLWYGFWFFASYFLKIGHSLFNFR